MYKKELKLVRLFNINFSLANRCNSNNKIRNSKQFKIIKPIQKDKLTLQPV
jgi:hypothetical protein